MRNALALARKELSIYFTTPWAWVVFTAMAVLSSFFFIQNLGQFAQVQEMAKAMTWGRVMQMYPQAEAFKNLTDGVLVPLVNVLLVIMLFMAPFLSMRLFAEEKKQRTMELLLTTPLTDLSQDFKDRLLEVNPDLADFNYSAESYDAVIITALAADLAGTDEPSVVAEEINGVTKDGDVCTTYQECVDLIDGGSTDIDYDGVSGPLSFGDAGEPSEASFGILTFGDNGIDDSLTTFEFAQV